MSKDQGQSIREILQSLPEEIKELTTALPPKYLEAANFYLRGNSMINACIRAKIIKTSDGPQLKAVKSSNVINGGLLREYINAVKDYQCSQTVMSLHEIDMRLSGIARTQATDVLAYRSDPVFRDDEEGNEVLVGYRSAPYLRPMEELTGRQKDSIKSIKQSKTGLEVELHDPVKAMDMLIKRKGGYTENVNTTTTEKKVHAFMPSNNRGPGSKATR